MREGTWDETKEEVLMSGASQPAILGHPVRRIMSRSLNKVLQ